MDGHDRLIQHGGELGGQVQELGGLLLRVLAPARLLLQDGDEHVRHDRAEAVDGLAVHRAPDEVCAREAGR